VNRSRKCTDQRSNCFFEANTRFTQWKPMILSFFVNIPLGSPKKFLKLEKSRIVQFPININLATTDHKLQGMMKKFLIISAINYSTPNWIYVVLSRVTTLDGLFFLHQILILSQPNYSKKNRYFKEIWKKVHSYTCKNMGTFHQI
jgi:hypothetical protein